MGISFLKVAKPCLIPLNGNLALKFCTGQPHKKTSAATVTFFACKSPLNKAQGAFDKLSRICVAAFRKEIPTALQSANDFFQNAKTLQNNKK